ncbi:MAG: hypothetical protein AAFY56_24755, partial [Pseudomonadota bacterium]
MRLLFAGLMLLALAAAAAFIFVLPKLDPDHIERKFAETLSQHGITVQEIGSASTASLVPQPTISFRDVLLEGPEASYRIAADRIDVELDLQSVFSPKQSIDSVRVVRPALDVSAIEPSQLITLSQLKSLPAFEVVDGVIDWPGSSGQQRFRLTDIVTSSDKSEARTDLELSASFRDQSFSLNFGLGIADAGGLFPITAEMFGNGGSNAAVSGLSSSDF